MVFRCSIKHLVTVFFVVSFGTQNGHRNNLHVYLDLAAHEYYERPHSWLLKGKTTWFAAAQNSIYDFWSKQSETKNTAHV